MQKSKLLLQSIGKLVQNSRSPTMDQNELAIRSGLGRNSISNIENGKSVSANSLFLVLEQLELIDELQAFIDHQLKNKTQELKRKSRNYQVLDNDF